MTKKLLFGFFMSIPLALVAQRVLVKLHSGDSDTPAGWPIETSNIVAFTNVLSGWSTNWTLAQLEAHRATLQPSMDAIIAAKQTAIETQRQTRIQLLQDLFQDFQQYENGWVAGTNYNNATLQVILRKHNGALLLLKPLLKELYDSRQ